MIEKHLFRHIFLFTSEDVPGSLIRVVLHLAGIIFSLVALVVYNDPSW